MTYKEFVEIYYIKAYMKNKCNAMKEFIKGSFSNASAACLGDKAVDGYNAGSSINRLATTLINEAIFNYDKSSQFIEKQYNKKPLQPNTEFQGKTYQEALYDRMVNGEYKDEFEGVTRENMANLLAKAFWHLILDAYNNQKGQSKKSNREMILENTISIDEKIAILSLCDTINRNMAKLKQLLESYDSKKRECDSLADNEVNKQLKKHLEIELGRLSSKEVSAYVFLKRKSSELSQLLSNKTDLHQDFIHLHDIASEIRDDEDSFPEGYFHFARLMKNFEKFSKSLREHIDNYVRANSIK